MDKLVVRGQKAFRALRFKLYGNINSHPKQRYSIVNRGELASLLGVKDEVQMMELHRQWVEALLKEGSKKRDAQWTEIIVVGDKDFVLETKARLGAKVVNRKILGKNGHYDRFDEDLLPPNAACFLKPFEQPNPGVLQSQLEKLGRFGDHGRVWSVLCGGSSLFKTLNDGFR